MFTKCMQLLADNTTRENMSTLVKTEHDKITKVESLSKGMKNLSIFSNIAFPAAAGFSFIMGASPEAAMLSTAVALGNIAMTGNWITHDLTANLRESGVSGKFKSSVFALWGKKKTYPVLVQKSDKKIQADLYVGRGNAYLVEHIPVEPLDLWDSSMSAVRELYKLRRGSDQRYKPYSEEYMGYDHGSYYYEDKYGRNSYDWYLEDYYAQVDEIRAREEKIKSYKNALENKNCLTERWREKQDKMKETKIAS